jgi:ABC-2 type transport system permease protein
MKIRRIIPLIRKEFFQIWRDKRSFTILLLFPGILIFVIGYALNFDVKHISIAIYDRDKSSTSRELIRNFSNSEYFDINYVVEDYYIIDQLLNRGDATVALVIPEDLGSNILAGKETTVQVLIDGSNANTATTAIAYIQTIIQTYSVDLIMDVLQSTGHEFLTPIDLRPKIWYNPELVTAKFLVPGLIGFILMISAVISTSLSVVREKERGTMEQMMVSSLTTLEIIVGKTVAYLIIAIVASAFVLVVGFLAFDVVVRGSILWLYVGILIFLLGGLGQGLLISTITNTQQVAFMVSVFSSLLPTFLLSGFVFPIRSMPIFLQILTNVTPAKFFLVVVRSEILKGTGPSAYWDQLIYLAIFSTIMITLSAMRLLKKAK